MQVYVSIDAVVDALCGWSDEHDVFPTETPHVGQVNAGAAARVGSTDGLRASSAAIAPSVDHTSTTA